MSADCMAPLKRHCELPVLECQGCDNLPHPRGATICHTRGVRQFATPQTSNAAPVGAGAANPTSDAGLVELRPANKPNR